jgi:glyoxylase-like metal-dependent hydrolase (beta-lactamase superfamily II)
MAIASIDYVDDARIGTDPGLMLVPPASAPQNWSTTAPWFDESGWVLPMGGFLVRTGGRTVLIDAGLGPGVEEMIAQAGVPARHEHSGRLLTSLAALGVEPDSVTDVVLTHLHSDHVGWTAPRGAPIFPHAKHICHEKDAARLREDVGANPAMAGVRPHIDAVADLLTTTDAQRTMIADGVALRLFAGHSPGNCIVELDTSGGPVLLLGDTAHHPVLLVEEGWTDRLDEDPVGAARSRADLVEEMERTAALAFGAHFPGGRGGRIIRSRNGRRAWVTQAE